MSFRLVFVYINYKTCQVKKINKLIGRFVKVINNEYYVGLLNKNI